MQMKRKDVLYLAVVIAMVLGGIYEVTSLGNAPDKYDDFAECLTGNGIIMYGTDWCPHCKDQKTMFGRSFRYINYVNCDSERLECDAAGVSGYPTWFISGSNYPGTQSLEQLSKLSNCSLSS